MHKSEGFSSPHDRASAIRSGDSRCGAGRRAPDPMTCEPTEAGSVGMVASPRPGLGNPTAHHHHQVNPNTHAWGVAPVALLIIPRTLISMMER
ncbi:hypothetical protein JYU34_010128 [Plutella xylostella]|uniref:Uncharacterized protein n=1 Tax=Plutella xylostella TaxID=51655 RepID=A0ABQ7PPL0_PLUXY|nr:hypothetical protein JYU34_022687 [Plutella xylostella]KAG7304771.1 hypothetical protein JYU34_010128 [Plutella xylostella]